MRPEVEIVAVLAYDADPQVRQREDSRDAILAETVRTPRDAVSAGESGLDDVNGLVQLRFRHASPANVVGTAPEGNVCAIFSWELSVVDGVTSFMSILNPGKQTNEGQCLRKSPYMSKTTAETTAQKCWEKRKVRLRAYLCPNCKWWHLTKMEEK